MSRSPQYIKLINSARWRTLRACVIREAKGLCRKCEREGRVSAATEVHHIRPIESVKDPDAMKRLAYDPVNLMAVCHECHRKIHEEMGKGSKEERRKRTRAEVEEFHRAMFGEDLPS